MNTLSSRTLILIGFFLVLAGAVLPFLMVIHILKSTYFLNLFSFLASMVGLILGMLGTVLYVRVHRR